MELAVFRLKLFTCLHKFIIIIIMIIIIMIIINLTWKYEEWQKKQWSLNLRFMFTVRLDLSTSSLCSLWDFSWIFNCFRWRKIFFKAFCSSLNTHSDLLHVTLRQISLLQTINSITMKRNISGIWSSDFFLHVRLD